MADFGMFKELDPLEPENSISRRGKGLVGKCSKLRRPSCGGDVLFKVLTRRHQRNSLPFPLCVKTQGETGSLAAQKMALPEPNHADTRIFDFQPSEL